jgi:hypothetical protein
MTYLGKYCFVLFVLPSYLLCLSLFVTRICLLCYFSYWSHGGFTPDVKKKNLLHK